MQTASIMLAIAGDTGSVIPKYDVTAGEIALLQYIHGAGAVTDIEPTGEIKGRSNRVELARLREVYGHAKDSDGNLVINQLYPGAAARVFETFDELDLDGSLYKAGRAPSAKKSSAKDEPEADEAKPLDEMTKAELLTEAKRRNVEIVAGASKGEILADLQAAEVEEDDGIEDMEDANSPLG